MRVEFQAITVDKVELSDVSGKVQAQLRQVLTKYYPKTKLSNSLNDALIASQASQVEEEAYEETRITWRPVMEGTTPEQVEQALEGMVEPCIYKILSSNPIFTDGDTSWMESLDNEDSKKYVEKLKIGQLVKTPDGEIIKDHFDQLQYRRNAFTTDLATVPHTNEAGVIDKRSKIVVLVKEESIGRISLTPETVVTNELVKQV